MIASVGKQIIGYLNTSFNSTCLLSGTVTMELINTFHNLVNINKQSCLINYMMGTKKKKTF